MDDTSCTLAAVGSRQSLPGVISSRGMSEMSLIACKLDSDETRQQGLSHTADGNERGAKLSFRWALSACDRSLEANWLPWYSRPSPAELYHLQPGQDRLMNIEERRLFHPGQGNVCCWCQVFNSFRWNWYNTTLFVRWIKRKWVFCSHPHPPSDNTNTFWFEIDPTQT